MDVNFRIFFSVVVRLSAIMLGCSALPAAAQELLSNPSFEAAVTPTPVNGNNFYATIPGWTVTNVTPARPLPVNLIRPHAGYANNPTATPTGGGSLYFDVNGAAGSLIQTVTFPSSGMVDMSGWYSVRDSQQALSGLTINVRNASNVIVATASTSFLATDPIGLWKQAAALNIPVAAGTHTFEAVLPNPANFDLASLVFKPALTTSKSSITISDGISGSNPKSIPDAVMEYTLSATSPTAYSVSSNTILIADTTPPNTALVVANIAGAGSGPALFTAGSTGLTYSFISLASATDDIEFSNNNAVSWTYSPAANANGVDPLVTTVRLRPKGTMAAASTLSFKLRYRIN